MTEGLLCVQAIQIALGLREVRLRLPREPEVGLRTGMVPSLYR
jgi:hypothetical protein